MRKWWFGVYITYKNKTRDYLQYQEKSTVSWEEGKNCRNRHRIYFFWEKTNTLAKWRYGKYLFAVQSVTIITWNIAIGSTRHTQERPRQGQRIQSNQTRRILLVLQKFLNHHLERPVGREVRGDQLYVGHGTASVTSSNPRQDCRSVIGVTIWRNKQIYISPLTKQSHSHSHTIGPSVIFAH